MLWRTSDCEELVGLLTGDDVVEEDLSDLIHCLVPLELYLITKRPGLPVLVPSSAPVLSPVT